MKHYFTTKVWTVLIIALVLAAGLTVFSQLTGLTVPEMVVQGVLTPVRTGVSRLTDQAEQLYSYMYRYESLAAENEALKQKIAQMENDARLADSVSRENDRLRGLLELPQIYETYELVDGYVIAKDSADWSSTLTINRGTNAGIRKGMCAVTANGEVVGLVTQVGLNYCVVKTVLDSSLGISAVLTSSGYSGMVQGNYVEGEETQLRMNYLPSEAVIRINDQVVTSGSTVYPRDLILGYVIDAGFDESGVAKFALLRPAADIDTLEQVFILTSYNGA